MAADEVEEMLEKGGIRMGGWVRLVGWESRILWHLSAASIIVSLFTYMLTFATLMFTGHLGSVPLAGASIASVGIQGLAYGIMVCMCHDDQRFIIYYIAGASMEPSLFGFYK